MVSVGQPLDVAVTLPQRGGGCVSESCGPERAFCAPLPLGLINLATAFFAAAHAAQPVALTSAARQECSTVTNDDSKARTDQEASVTDTSLNRQNSATGQLIAVLHSV